MGRFRDLWASGKIAIKHQKEFEGYVEKEGRDLIPELMPGLEVNPDSQQVFSNIKSRRGQETGRWLRDLKNENSAVPQQAESAQAAESAYEEAARWVNMLFQSFEDITFEFNKSAIGTDLMVSCEMPKTHEEKSDELWYRPVTKTRQGRLTTRDWALVVRGHEKKVAIFLIPTPMLLGFASSQASESGYAPFMEVMRDQGPPAAWTIGGEPIGIRAIPELAKCLLGDLIRVTSGVMSEAELFSTDKDSCVKLGENVAVGMTSEQKQASAARAAVPLEKMDLTQMGVSDACDIVDGIIDQELKRLYEKATTLGPSSQGAAEVRKRISSVEKFRSKVVEAFEEFTHATAAETESKQPV
jgi:hypothetical protein